MSSSYFSIGMSVRKMNYMEVYCQGQKENMR